MMPGSSADGLVQVMAWCQVISSMVLTFDLSMINRAMSSGFSNSFMPYSDSVRL